MRCTADSSTLSRLARLRMLSVRGEPLFDATWVRAVFIHYEADPDLLQQCVPFALDLYEGRAFVSLVGFTMRRMRPRRGGRIAEWILKPIATHEFLNVRTYVRSGDERGIYFLSEWLSNRLSIPLGPLIFGLPYHHARITYDHSEPGAKINGHVEARQGRIQYRGEINSDDPRNCATHSVEEFLMERYTAFTSRRGFKRLFRVWHEPWTYRTVDLSVTDVSLLSTTGDWAADAQHIGSAYSPGVDVWMGRPLRLSASHQPVAHRRTS